MKKKQSWPEDPVVREVREVRQKLWKEAGGTIKGLQRLVSEIVGETKKSKPKKRRTKD